MSKLEQFVLNFPWVKAEHIPFTQLGKPLSKCNVALVSTGGLYGPHDSPFAITNSTDVDESYREIPTDLPLSTLRVAHEHFNKTHAAADMNVIFPVERLQSLVEDGFIGQLAQTNYSISGYIPRPDQLFETGRAIAASMLAQGVDAALIVPV